MLDPIINFFSQIFSLIGRGIGWVIGIILWPFMWLARWYTGTAWTWKAIVGAILVGIVALYGYFFYQTQFWINFNPDYPDARTASVKQTLAGDPVAPSSAGTAIAQAETPAPTSADPVTAQAGTAPSTTPATPPAAPGAPTCERSAIVDVSADLIDYYVNQNRWVPSMLASTLGFFGIPWRHTPYFDNKAAYQLGMNQVMRRTTTELVDTLGRVRGTSQIDQNLQNARSNMAWDEEAWYIGTRGPTRPTPDVYREAIEDLQKFNSDLAQCRVSFDGRADNLQQFLDRIAGDIGSTSDILRARMEQSNAGWFDPRADDRFWFAYGQLYAYHGILKAARKDFGKVIVERNLTAIWDRMEEQLRLALNMQPAIISNGSESSFIFPSHLANMGFYLLRVRSQIVEIRAILER